ncbi:unnamed protein product [Pseudo-nitzschia multistriata]|uniref:Sulfotransferase domain-containing protein n=1 Tax=Pseudo-nitzschia multistriata TaxID=183589 RepID=A0A448Z0G0_9STRA|nr:unnamed protein product [Pseudo-nitzschia multistriata]
MPADPSAPTEPPGPGTIRVICAGLGRTGTLSLSEALSTLGYRPYHFIDFSHAEEWAGLAEGTSDAGSLLDRIVADGYDAVLENPSCDVFDDLRKRFPDARVILTVRDSAEAFEESWKVLMDTMVVTEQPFSWAFPSFFGWIPLFRRLRVIRRFMGTTHLGLEEGALAHGWRDRPSGWLAEQYDRHNQHVVDSVPPEQLLVFRAGDGWEPLCSFLGTGVPGGAFPFCTTNNKEALRRLRTTFLAAVYGWIPVTALAAAGAVALGRRACGAPRAGR